MTNSSIANLPVTFVRGAHSASASDVETSFEQVALVQSDLTGLAAAGEEPKDPRPRLQFVVAMLPQGNEAMTGVWDAFQVGVDDTLAQQQLRRHLEEQGLEIIDLIDSLLRKLLNRQSRAPVSLPAGAAPLDADVRALDLPIQELNSGRLEVVPRFAEDPQHDDLVRGGLLEVVSDPGDLRDVLVAALALIFVSRPLLVADGRDSPRRLATGGERACLRATATRRAGHFASHVRQNRIFGKDDSTLSLLHRSEIMFTVRKVASARGERRRTTYATGC